MKNGTYSCVICFSQCGAGLRIAFWWETTLRRNQNTTPHWNL